VPRITTARNMLPRGTGGIEGQRLPDRASPLGTPFLLRGGRGSSKEFGLRTGPGRSRRVVFLRGVMR
jgi:hypothetical protein